MNTRVFFLTLFAMIAFASNSLLCRAALKHSAIDAASFTLVRIVSGAALLWLSTRLRRSIASERSEANVSTSADNWWSALALFAYAAAFSFAYNTLAAGTGALLLFGAVQATMLLWGLRNNERLRMIEVAGLIVALVGLVVLVFPGLSAPPLIGSILMLGAGIAWGIYSLRGKTARHAIAATTGNFVRAVPFAAALNITALPWMRVDRAGLAYAVISGAITSGLGYVIWYSALPHLRSASAATVQLSVPVLAATGGILLLAEPVTLRYVVASMAVLGGIALVVVERNDSTSGR